MVIRIKVKVKLNFEVEYPLDMDFFEGDATDAMALEVASYEEDPGLLFGLFRDKGTTTVTIREVERGGSED